MFRINHNDAIELEHQVRRLYNCNRGGVSGLADADVIEENPITAAIMIISYIYAKDLLNNELQYEAFLYEYYDIFEHADEEVDDEMVRGYIKELSDIVDEYIN